MLAQDAARTEMANSKSRRALAQNCPFYRTDVQVTNSSTGRARRVGAVRRRSRKLVILAPHWNPGVRPSKLRGTASVGELPREMWVALNGIRLREIWTFCKGRPRQLRERKMVTMGTHLGGGDCIQTRTVSLHVGSEKGSSMGSLPVSPDAIPAPSCPSPSSQVP